MLVALPGPHGNSGVGVSKPLRISINPLVVGQFEIAPSHRMDSMARKGATLRPWGLTVRRRPMQKVNRRSAVALGLAAASAAMVKPAAAQTTDYKDETPWPGVVVRAYSGETPSLIPGFKTVSMLDVIMQPGSKTMFPPMEHAMICHITEGELQIEQEGKTFTAKKNFVWTCNKNTKEQSSNVSNAVAIMRVTELMA
jgi:hypothetical protein